MKKIQLLLFVILATMLTVSVGFAAEKSFKAKLTGKGEVPSVKTKATGEVKFKLSSDGKELSYMLDVKNIENATTRLPEITDAVADEAKDLPGLVRQTQTSMRELERLVEAVQRHWLVRKYVNKTDPPPLRPLAEVEEPARKPFKPPRSPKDTTR